MYHDYLGREIEDIEMDNMRQDWYDLQREEKEKRRNVWKKMKQQRARFDRRGSINAARRLKHRPRRI